MNQQKPFSKYVAHSEILFDEFKNADNPLPLKRFCAIHINQYAVSKFHLLWKAHGKFVNRNRNISGVTHYLPYATTYSVNYFLHEFENIAKLYFKQFPYHAVKYIDVVDNFIYVAVQFHVNGTWALKALSVIDFLKIFPAGVPITEKDFHKWWSYICHTTLQTRRNDLRFKLDKLTEVERAKLEIEVLREKISELELFIVNNSPRKV